ncbi:class I SAM-dependent methyltransferase [Methylorubrum extorquens]
MSQMSAEELERLLFGRWVDSFNVDRMSWLSAGLSSADYALEHMEKAERVPSLEAIIDFCLERAPGEGLMLEFGVFSGRTITHIANRKPSAKVFGFDSFEGLPEDWVGSYTKGSFALDRLPNVPGNVELVPGWFDRTLPSFCDGRRGSKISLLHVDCDLYSSTQTIFANLNDMIVPGTIILFDEYFNYPNWQKHEARAFAEFCKARDRQYEYIALVPNHQQVAVRILK